MPVPADPLQRQWYIVGRWQAFAGETRANLLRIAAIAAFYLVELINYQAGHVADDFHRAVTAIAAGYVLFAAGVLLMLRRRMFPAWLPYLSSAIDLLAVSAVLIVGQGPRSPMVLAYFLVIAVSALRFQLRLIWCTTLGSMLGYLVVLAMTHPDWFGSPQRAFTVPRYEQAITLIALAFTGIVLGQVIRQVKAIAQEFGERTGNDAAEGV